MITDDYGIIGKGDAYYGNIIYGINQHGSQMYINSIDDSDKLNVVKDNGSIDSGSNGISDNSNSMPGDFADNQNSRNNAPKFSDPEKLFNIKKNNGFDFTEKSVKFNQDDIDKAIDDMKKEVVLEQYTYFVEPANLGTDADGTVRLKG